MEVGIEETIIDTTEESTEESTDESFVEYDAVSNETIVLADNYYDDDLNDLSLTGILGIIVILFVLAIALRRE